MHRGRQRCPGFGGNGEPFGYRNLDGLRLGCFGPGIDHHANFGDQGSPGPSGRGNRANRFPQPWGMECPQIIGSSGLLYGIGGRDCFVKKGAVW